MAPGKKKKKNSLVSCQLTSCNRVVMHETCTKAVKGMPQCKNSLANCANLRAVAGMPITGWKQGCNMAVTGCLLRNLELNVTWVFQCCYSVETALLTVPNDEL